MSEGGSDILCSLLKLWTVGTIGWIVLIGVNFLFSDVEEPHDDIND